MQLFVEPLDVWLFRDGRPFDAGSDHRARCLFPPPPSVMQGAIRSHQLVRKGIDLRDKKAMAAEVGTRDDYRQLRLRGPILGKRDGQRVRRYFAVPADTRVRQDGGVEPLEVVQRPPRCLTSVDDEMLPLLLAAAGEPEKEGKARWLDESSLKAVLSRQPAKAISDGDLFTRESRIGIERDEATRATRSEKLYEAEYVRPCQGVGLWLEVRGYDGWPPNGVMRMGGEGRAARYSQSADDAWPGIALDGPLPARFTVYFATPAYFCQGWRPDDWGRFFEGEVSLKAAALGGYDTIGGYDWAAGRQKASRRFVPAGSVYYFEAIDGARLRPDLDNWAVTEWGGEIGFGQVIISEWRA